MGVIIYSFNLNISPKMSYGVLERDSVMLQNSCLGFCNKRFCNKNGASFGLDPVYVNILSNCFLYTWIS